MRYCLLLAMTLLVCGCSSAPPVQVPGKWQGWAEPAMETKTGLFLDLTQTDAKVTGTWRATKIVAGEGEEEKGQVEGTVKGDTLTITWGDKPPFELDKSVELKLTGEGDKRVLAGLMMREGGMGCKYHFEPSK